MKNYKLKDMKLVKVAGAAPVEHAYQLQSLKDGSTQFLNSEGDVVASQDRFGHVTKLSWKLVNGKHRLTSVEGAWGSKLTASYVGSKVTFTSPKRWGQSLAPTVVLDLSQNRVASVTDAAKQTTRVEYSNPIGASAQVYPSAVVSPIGARTEFKHREYEPRSGGVVAVSEIQVKGADGRTLLDPVTLTLDPDGANGGRNWTGCPQYCGSGTDALEESGDGSFTYRVRMSQKNGQEVERTYNALHLQKTEVVRVKQGAQSKEISRTQLSYPGEKSDGAPPKVSVAPGDYQMPSAVELVTVDPNDSSRRKEGRATTRFDDMGNVVQQTQGGVETSTQYGVNSLPVRTETKDTRTEARRVVESTLTPDGKAIAKTVTKAGGPEGGGLKTVSTTEFEYHGGEFAGEVRQTRTTGDTAAQGGDPGAAVTRTESTVERDGDGVGRRTDTVTGSDNVASTTVSDLASGASLSQQTGDLGLTKTEYDVADRPVKSVTADGAVTTMSYDTREGGTSTTSSRQSDGFASRSVSDELGREVKRESNYAPSAKGGQGEILPEGQWKRISEAKFNAAGQPVESIDAAGRVTTTEYNEWGRPEKVRTPDGAVSVTSYDDIAGTTTSELTPDGANEPTNTSVQTVDDQGNPVKAETAFGDGTPGSFSETTFDSFGNPQKSMGSSGVTTEHTYTASGLPESDTVTPATKGEEKAPTMKAGYIQDGFGNRTEKTLSSTGQSVSGWKKDFDAAGRVSRLTAPGGGATTDMIYDETNGIVKAIVLADGSVGHQRTDNVGRTIDSWTSPKDAPDAQNEHVRTSYDPVTGQKSAQWFADDESGSKVTFAYFPDGTLRERVDPGGKKTSYTYTDEAKPATVTDHSGATTTYSYDPKTGRISEVAQSRDGKELAKIAYHFNATGKLEKIDRGNGASSTYAYNDAGLPVSERHTKPGGALIAEHAYTYTHGSEPKLTTDIATVDGKQTSTVYTNDDTGRLTQSHVTEGHKPGEGTLVSKADYAYDLASNLTEKKVTTRSGDGTEHTKTTGYRHDSASRTTHVIEDGKERPQVYDAASRLVEAADGTRHSYNSSGQLVEIVSPDNTSVKTTYLPTGERASQITAKNDTVNTISFHPGVETDQDGNTATYLIGLNAETRTLTRDGQTDVSYYVTNRHGDKTHTLDKNGETVSHTTYSDFGSPQNPETGQPQAPLTGVITENPRGYAGEHTTPTGHQPLGVRLYDPKKASLTTLDTPAASTLNPFAYANGDPVNNSDPTGQFAEPAWKWMNENVLGWKGMPYIDIGLAAAGVAITVLSGGTAAPVGAALTGRVIATRLALTVSTLATVPSATDQIAIDTRGEGYLPREVRTGFDVAGLVGGIGDAGLGVAHGSSKLFKQTRAGFVGQKQRATGATLNELLNQRPAEFRAIGAGESPSFWARQNPQIDPKITDNTENVLFYDQLPPRETPDSPKLTNVDTAGQASYARIEVDPDDSDIKKLSKVMEDLKIMTAAQRIAGPAGDFDVLESINARLRLLQTEAQEALKVLPQNSNGGYTPTLFVNANDQSIMFTDAYIYPRGGWNPQK